MKRIRIIGFFITVVPILALITITTTTVSKADATRPVEIGSLCQTLSSLASDEAFSGCMLGGGDANYCNTLREPAAKRAMRNCRQGVYTSDMPRDYTPTGGSETTVLVSSENTRIIDIAIPRRDPVQRSER